jgi:hypothetical protein
VSKTRLRHDGEGNPLGACGAGAACGEHWSPERFDEVMRELVGFLVAECCTESAETTDAKTAA